MFTALSAVSLNDLQPSTGTGIQSNTPGVNAPKQAPTPVSQTDTVKLSVTQQVRNLHSEGEGPGQIASSLGLTSTQVSGDLYVSLTWPQLLSKVASSSLGLAPTPSDASVSGITAPDSATSAPAAVLFPTTKGESGSAAVASPGTKEASLLIAKAFPGAKDASVPATVAVPGVKDFSVPAAFGVAQSRDATAA